MGEAPTIGHYFSITLTNPYTSVMAIINTNKLNLEEQEKFAAVNHFWKSWGVAISGAITVALLITAGWFGYGWYQKQQSDQATTLFEQVLADAQANDTEKLATSLKTLQTQYPATVQAQQAGLLAARIFYEKGQNEQSRAALSFVTEHNADKGLQSTAKLQLAGLMIEQKQYDEATRLLTGSIDPAYEALAADRLGDAYALQGKRGEAIAAYSKAYQAMDAGLPYRQMVAAKLNGFGVDVNAPAAASSASAASAATPSTSQ